MSLYDDASLALLTGAGAGKDGKLYVAKPEGELGEELIINGGFDADSNWNEGAGWNIAGGKASCDGTNTASSILQTSQPLTIQNIRVKFSFEISDYEAGTLNATIQGTGGNEFANISSNGIYATEATSVDAAAFVIFTASAGFIGSIDNVSIKEVIVPAGDFEFNRGSNLTATRVNASGLIEKGRENLLTYSNTFSSWSVLQITRTSGQSGYDGSNDAWLLTDTATSGDHRLYLANSHSGVNTLSVYAKAGTKSIVYVQSYINNSSIAYFDLSAGSVLSTAVGIDSKIESVGNGWYRCSMAFNNTNTYVTIGIAESATRSYVGDGTGTIYIQDAQLEVGLAATDYIESGASTGKAGLLENEPRFDYSGGATCPSLLVESLRTQLVPYTEYLNTSTSWSAYPSADPVTHTQNYAIAPDGTKTASLLGNFTSAGFNIVNNSNYRTSTLATQNPLDDTYTMSVWLKTTSGTGTITLLNRGLTSGTNSPQLLQCNVTNEWQRFDISNTYTAAENASSLGFIIIKNTTDTLEEVLVWGAQMEQGSYPTSYIPNHSGASITRNRDFANGVANDAQIGDNIGKGTWLIDIKRAAGEANQSLFLAPKANLTQQIRLHFDLNGVMRFRDARNGYATIGAGLNTTERAKFLIKVDTDGGIAKVFINGAQVGDTYVLGAVPFEFGRIIIENRHYNLYSTVFFPEALTDVECIKLTEL